MAPKYPNMMVLPSVEAVLVCFLSMMIAWSAGLGDGTVILTKDAHDPATESVQVVEGGTLVLHCSVSTALLYGVWWGKKVENQDIYFTENLQHNLNLATNDYRVAVSRSVDFTEDEMNYCSYSLRINRVDASDDGFYFCFAKWQLSASNSATIRDASGPIEVSVINFSNGTPECELTRDSASGIWVNCETEHAHSGVKIAWTIEETSRVLSVQSATNRTDPSGRQWVQGSLSVSQEMQNQVLICTITSPAFPGRNQTCSVIPSAGTVSPTQSLDAANAELTEPTLSRGSTVTSTHQISVAHEVPSGYFIVWTLWAIIVGFSCFSFFICLFCILKQKRQQGDRRAERKQLRATRTTGDRSDGKTNRSNGADVSHTTIQTLSIGGRADSARRTSFLLGEETCEPSYGECHGAAVGNSCVTFETVSLEDSDTDSVTQEKQEYDTLYQKTLPAPTGRSGGKAEAQEASCGSHGSCVVYETLNPGDSDCDPVTHKSNHQYQEPDNIDTGVLETSRLVAWATISDSGNSEDKVNSLPSDESGEGMVDNPVYQPYDEKSSKY